MPFDALTIAAIADELRQTCLGGRIQAVFLPAPLAIGIEIYARRATRCLFASAHPQHARAHLTQEKLRRGSDDVTPLLLLLRKYVRDGRLAAIEQPALERTLTLIITKALPLDKGRADAPTSADSLAGHVPIAQPPRLPPGDASDNPAGETPTPRTVPQAGLPMSLSTTEDETTGPDITTVRIIIEMMGRYSNIVLVDGDGVVMEAVKHVPAEINRYRVTLPRHPYVAPPPQDKADPRAQSAASLDRLLAANPSQPAWQSLVRAHRGISPLLAREAVFRACGDSGAGGAAVPAAALAETLAALLSAAQTQQWSPTLAHDGEALLDFAPYALTQFGESISRVDSMSEAVQAFYAQETVAADYQGQKQTVQKLLQAQRSRVERRTESLQSQANRATAAGDLRVKGEMLFAYASQITPGQSEVTIEIEANQPPLRIKLDPALSVVENAQAYFKRYTQARDAAKALPPLLEEAALDLAYLDQLQLDLDLAEGQADISDVQRLLNAAGAPEQTDKKKGKPPARPERKATPLSVTSGDGMEIVIGRNARQNDYVTFELSSPLDLWLHARGVAGSHVIIRSLGRPVAQATLEQAAALAAAHSAARSSSSVAVDYTQRRHVRRARGSAPGMVYYTNERTVQARPAKT